MTKPDDVALDAGGLDAAEEPRKTLADSTQVYPAHREIVPETGMQRGYVVLAEEERAKGFVRPVRRTYTHLKCGGTTTMAQTIAETYARDPYQPLPGRRGRRVRLGRH